MDKIVILTGPSGPDATLVTYLTIIFPDVEIEVRSEPVEEVGNCTRYLPPGVAHD
jgi:hypothetical protein